MTKFLTRQELADRWRMTTRTVSEHLASGDLRATKVGRRILISESDVIAYEANKPLAHAKAAPGPAAPDAEIKRLIANPTGLIRQLEEAQRQILAGSAPTSADADAARDAEIKRLIANPDELLRQLKEAIRHRAAGMEGVL